MPTQAAALGVSWISALLPKATNKGAKPRMIG